MAAPSLSAVSMTACTENRFSFASRRLLQLLAHRSNKCLQKIFVINNILITKIFLFQDAKSATKNLSKSFDQDKPHFSAFHFIHSE
jgi:hypothetical protein